MMTKKEAQYVRDMENRLRIQGALRSTTEVMPDVPIPDRFDDLAKGFLPAGTDRVEVACSSRMYHAVGRDDKTTSQDARPLYSTRLLALRALRYKLERECAVKLAMVDQQIDAELQASL